MGKRKFIHIKKLTQLQNNMAMASTRFFTPLSSTRAQTNSHIMSFHTYLPSSPLQYNPNKREVSLPAVSSFPFYQQQPINVDYLQREFSGHGVTFSDIGDNCIVKMRLDNGTMATIMLPSGLITSYKAPMWHGGTLEMLHTLVSENGNGGAVIQGGVSLAFNCKSEDEHDGGGGISWSPNTWALHDVGGNPEDSIKVELISTDSEDMVEVKHIVTLQEDDLSSELVILNSKSIPLQVTGSVISHLTISTADATYAVGLEGSDYTNKPPFLSKFGIIPPEFGQKKEASSSQIWGQTALNRFVNEWGGAKNQNQSSYDEAEMTGEESDNYKHLTEKMSRIYTSAPRNFTLIDRGRRNSVVVRRDGFDELYMFSPGSSNERYSKYDYVCIGQSALLEPVIVGPKDVWRGVQHLHNPNL